LLSRLRPGLAPTLFMGRFIFLAVDRFALLLRDVVGFDGPGLQPLASLVVDFEVIPERSGRIPIGAKAQDGVPNHRVHPRRIPIKPTRSAIVG
jgi:hypothetical protein